MERVNERPVLDVSGLPTVVFGPRNVVWLGTVLFMLIEGSMVAMLVASYFYYRTRVGEWPPGVMPPALRWGVANSLVFVLSIAPALWIQKAARAGDLARVRIGLVVLAAFGAINILFRVFEFAALNCKWDSNAYGSTVWSLLGVHSAHLATDFIETVVLAVLAFIGPVDGERMTNFDENSDYWYFVVAVALVTDVVVYGASRWL